MPKAGRGGKTGASNIPQQVQRPKLTVNLINPNLPTFDQFQTMADDQKADVLAMADKTQVPDFLSDTSTQRILYGLQAQGKPALVSDDVLDTMQGAEVFRTVNSVYDKAKDMGWSAKTIADQNLTGFVTRVSDTGGSVHGRGLYFADKYQNSAGTYGRVAGDVHQTAVIRGKLKPTAKVIPEFQANRGVAQEIQSGTKLGRVLNGMHRYDQISVYAIAKGYQAIHDSFSGYYVVLDRSALTMSTAIKAKGIKWK